MKFDFTKLNKFTKGISTNYIVKVGIFGSKNARKNIGTFDAKIGHRKAGKKKATLTNAEVGFIHEMGSPAHHIPQRSFLRMPLTMKSNEIIRDAELGRTFKETVDGNEKAMLERLGIACVKWIELAFASRGFGQWLPDSLITALKKGSSEPLIDTAQLRRSITYAVEEG